MVYYSSIVSKKHNLNKLRYVLWIGLLVAVFGFLALFRPHYFGLLLPLSNWKDDIFNKDARIASHLEPKPICNVKEGRSDFCEITGDIRIQSNSSSVHISSLQGNYYMPEKPSHTIYPYSRRPPHVPTSVKNWTINLIQPHNKIPQCHINHTVPAILFSIGGFVGNHFHDFTDLIIPLFITSRHFNGHVQFLTADYKSWWINKFRPVFNRLTKYKIIDIDSEYYVHCYSSVVIGLKSHKKELRIESLSSSSMSDFRQFLRSTYGLKRTNVVQLRSEGTIITKPRLMIISRTKTRRFENVDEINEMARGLGYEVVNVDDDVASDVAKFAQIVNSCDVLMGVHGAGLTNMVFLPDNAVVIQILPFGKMGYIARLDFGEPAVGMKLRYLEYNISVDESSLIREYSADDVVIRDPSSISKHGWNSFESIYLDKQDVKLDVMRFRSTLSTALKMLRV